MGYALPTSSPSCVEGMVQSQRFHQNLVNLGKQIVPNLNLEPWRDMIASAVWSQRESVENQEDKWQLKPTTSQLCWSWWCLLTSFRSITWNKISRVASRHTQWQQHAVSFIISPSYPILGRISNRIGCKSQILLGSCKNTSKSWGQ